MSGTVGEYYTPEELTEDLGMSRISIVEPSENASGATRRLFQSLLPGSVAVSNLASEGVSEALVYYEGGKYTRQGGVPATDDDRRSYAIIAAGRLVDRYPTTARFALLGKDAIRDLKEVGYVDTHTWNVVIYR